MTEFGEMSKRLLSFKAIKATPATDEVIAEVEQQPERKDVPIVRDIDHKRWHETTDAK